MADGDERSTVSVVLPVRDGARHLQAALDSLTGQSRPPDQIVVVDGHSSDGSAIIAAHHPRTEVHAQRGRGLYDAYNEGVGATAGRLVGFLAADDRWAPDKLELQVAAYEAHPSARYVWGNARYHLEFGTDAPVGFRTSLLDGPVPSHQLETMLCERTLFDEIGLFRTDLPVAGDMDWYSRARDAGVEAVYLGRPLVDKIVHGGNNSLAPHDAELLDVVRRSVRRKART